MENYVIKAKKLIESHDRELGISNDFSETKANISAFNEIQQTENLNKSLASQQKRKRSTSDVIIAFKMLNNIFSFKF
jgi:hypothetical protein